MDTHFLITLRHLLVKDLQDRSLWEQAQDVFAKACTQEIPERSFDLQGYRRIHGFRNLNRISKLVLEAVYLYRDRRARELDRAPFRVMSNEVLLRLANHRPTNLEELQKTGGLPRPYRNGRLAAELLTVLQQALRAAGPHSLATLPVSPTMTSFRAGNCYGSIPHPFGRRPLMQLKPLVLKDCYKTFRHDQDKVRNPEETLQWVKERLQTQRLNILTETVRIDTGRLGIPVFISLCGDDATRLTGTKKQMGKGRHSGAIRSQRRDGTDGTFQLLFLYPSGAVSSAALTAKWPARPFRRTCSAVSVYDNRPIRPWCRCSCKTVRYAGRRPST